MTQKQIETAAINSVNRNEDLYIDQSIEWLHDGGYIDWKQYCQIRNALTKARRIIDQPD